MRHLDLFSGIGGFALAALQVWGKDYECVGFCDIEPYAQELLKLRFPGVPIYDDIRKLTAERITADANKRRQEVKEQQTAGHKQRDRELIQANGLNTDTDSDRRTGRKQGKHTAKSGEQAQHGAKGRVDLLTAGVPCQPASTAGQRKGDKDDRWLWPETDRIIKEFRPRWVILENVAGLFTLLEQECITEMEDHQGKLFEESNEKILEGIYRRALARIIENLKNAGYILPESKDGTPIVYNIPACAINAPHRRDRIWIVAHATDSRHRGRSRKGQGRDRGVASNNNNKGLQGATKSGNIESKEQNRTEHFTGQTGWTENWLEVATRLCGVDDGLSAILDGLKLSKAGHRVARLKGLGNAIVPAVAVELMRSIKSAEGKR